MPSETTWQEREGSRNHRTSSPVSCTFPDIAGPQLTASVAWIAETGIGEQRDAVKSKEADQTLRQKTRERVQPKMGKIDIDYQKLHDAFFRFQGTPSMSKFGEA